MVNSGINIPDRAYPIALKMTKAQWESLSPDSRGAVTALFKTCSMMLGTLSEIAQITPGKPRDTENYNKLRRIRETANLMVQTVHNGNIIERIDGGPDLPALGPHNER